MAATCRRGGNFTTIGGQSRSRIAALDRTTGTATSWDPGSDSTVRALSADGSRILSGEMEGSGADPESLGSALAQQLKAQGAADILAQLQQ